MCVLYNCVNEKNQEPDIIDILAGCSLKPPETQDMDADVETYFKTSQ